MLLHLRQMTTEIGDRTDRLGDEYETIGVTTTRQALHILNERRLHTRAGEFVVGHRGMAKVSREKQFILGLTRNDQFAIGQAPRLERAIDANLIGLIGQLLLLSLRHTEAPALFIIGSDIGNPVGLVGLCIDMLEQFLPTHRLVNGQGITQHMEVALTEIDDRLALHRTDPAATDVPLLGNGPVEDLRACGHLEHLYLGNGLTDHLQ